MRQEVHFGISNGSRSVSPAGDPGAKHDAQAITAVDQLRIAIVSARIESSAEFPRRQVLRSVEYNVPIGRHVVMLRCAETEIVVSLPSHQVCEGVVVSVRKEPFYREKLRHFGNPISVRVCKYLRVNPSVRALLAGGGFKKNGDNQVYQSLSGLS
jgi:hypothetical protein